ncbi:DUF2956 domain-containing protein [Paraglaciecola sp. L3A3]|uniref:DUF2956 domain-containing protein n=1 Tax=Paraglaciecola sp. L3A3 TaxID=2686358 RepID=UPI00131AAD37|nr:DUF2956 domain-containing protein [Paraglaciecola sp. L3A3]
MKQKVSPEVEAQALKIAKGTQKPGQTKEQTKLIAQGIEKGIAEYKKQHSKKLREIDKQRKQKTKQPVQSHETEERLPSDNQRSFLPWILLGLSWLAFIAYFVLQS